MSMPTQKQVIMTFGQQIKNNFSCASLESIAPCNHEEAETRMLLHAAHAVACGYKRIMLPTVDTDVHVLAVFTVQMLKDRECQPFELWVSLGSGRNHRNIPAHMIASSLGPHKARSLPAFLAFTGCDTVSSFLGKGKKTAIAIWRCFPEATESFPALTSHPSHIN